MSGEAINALVSAAGGAALAVLGLVRYALGLLDKRASALEKANADIAKSTAERLQRLEEEMSGIKLGLNAIVGLAERLVDMQKSILETQNRQTELLAKIETGAHERAKQLDRIEERI